MFLDAFNGRVYFVGEGGYEIKLSPGSYAVPTRDSPSGHMMLPVSCWGQSQTGPTKSLHLHASAPAKQVTFEDHGEESPDELPIVEGWE